MQTCDKCGAGIKHYETAWGFGWKCENFPATCRNEYYFSLGD